MEICRGRLFVFWLSVGEGSSPARSLGETESAVFAVRHAIILGMTNSYDYLEPFLAALGRPLVAYMLNVDRVQLDSIMAGTAAPSPAQQELLDLLRKLSIARLPYETEDNRPAVIRALITQVDDPGIPVARRLRIQAGGADPATDGGDGLQSAIKQLAVDVYPLYLLPPEPDPFPRLGSNIEVVRAI